MSKVSITRSLLDDLAMSISAKSGEAVPMTLTEMKDAVDSIQTGGGHVTQDQDGYVVLPKTGGGGGGSSDFSTATVTVAYSPASSGRGTSPGLKVYGLINIDDEVGVQCDPVTIPDNSSKNLIVPLYKGKTSLPLSSEPEDVDWDLEGAYSFDDETGNTIITGDCTITIL